MAGAGVGAGAGPGTGAGAGWWCGSLRLLLILAKGQALALWPMPRQLKQRTMGEKRANILMNVNFYNFESYIENNSQEEIDEEFLFHCPDVTS